MKEEKKFEEFNLENEINNTVEHFKMHEFSHNTNYEAYLNYNNKRLKLNYTNKIYYHFNDTEFGMDGNNNYPGNACFLFGNLIHIQNHLILIMKI